MEELFMKFQHQKIKLESDAKKLNIKLYKYLYVKKEVSERMIPPTKKELMIDYNRNLVVIQKAKRLMERLEKTSKDLERLFLL